MAINKQPVARKCRALGVSPAEMGYGKKQSKRNPGGTRRKKVSEYGAQLKEKQKVKFVYGVLEKQFHKYYLKATNMKGITGDNMLQLREGTSVVTPKWLTFDAPNLTGKVVALPTREDVSLEAEMSMIVEFYSR